MGKISKGMKGGRMEARAQVLAMINQKGGVGKSSVAYNLGAVCAANGRKTLLVDLDCQGTLGAWFLTSSKTQRLKYEAKAESLCIEDAFEDPAKLDRAVKGTGFEGLDILCASQRLSEFEAAMRDTDVLASLLDRLVYRYDYIILDFRRDYEAASERLKNLPVKYIVPIHVGDSEVEEGVRKVASDLAGTGEFKVLFNEVEFSDKSGFLHIRTIRDVTGIAKFRRQFAFVPVFGCFIRDTTCVGEASQAFTPLQFYRPRHPVAGDFRQLYAEVEEWCGKAGKRNG